MSQALYANPDSIGFLEALWADYCRDPQAVPPAWRQAFADQGPPAGLTAPAPVADTLFYPACARAARSPALPPLPGSNGQAPSPAALRRLPFVQRVALFRNLPVAAQVAVAESVHEVDFAAGQQVFCAGDPAAGMYVLTAGSMRVERGGQVVARLGAGEVLGEMALMDTRSRSADAFAQDQVAALFLGREVFEALLSRHGELARGLFHLAGERLRHTSVRQELVDGVIRSYRSRGHLVANIDPLGRRPTRHPELELGHHGLAEADLDLQFSTASMGGGTMTLRQIVRRMTNTYCRTIGVQFMHIDNSRLRSWLQARMEVSENRLELSRAEQIRVLRKLTAAETFETFVHRKFLGAKRFSLEGAESLIPLLDTAIERAASLGAEQIVLGMAHRGRLNVLVNTLGKSAQRIFHEFNDELTPGQRARGDVKYHLGFSADCETLVGKNVHVSLCFNPSHLEFVDAVVAGRARAKQDRISDMSRKRVVPMVIHGDAAFSGQGVVQEMLNMSDLPGYTCGGTVHIIVNNQVGFTTPPEMARSSMYATDVARMLEVPIFHVNGEDPEGVAQTVRLALEFRAAFGRDVIIDMYCYRRLGHNEGDEPTFTQPVMYQWIQKQPTVRQVYLENLVKLGGIDRQEAESITEQCRSRLEEELAAARRGQHEGNESTRGSSVVDVWEGYQGGRDREAPDVDTGVARARLTQLMDAMTRLPERFQAHPKLVRLLEGRREMGQGARPLDWGAAEALAMATLVADGQRVRLSGQDSQRGTFSHRHAVLHDFAEGGVWVPLQHVTQEQAPFEVIDSPLSETGVLGFDYGYSLDYPDALVVWEAQFGDFVNGAQVIVDQFIATGEQKWQRLSGLVMLLPHGFEGQGPEHSSARLERFLALGAEDNIQVVQPSTPAQIFHVLRRQVCRKIRKPLVVMSPKSLLRHPSATSDLEALSGGKFARVLADARFADLKAARKVVLCTGKVYYELSAAREGGMGRDVALLRLEQLFPLPNDELAEVLGGWPEDRPLLWVQEEPRNMGTWPSLSFASEGRLLGRWPLHCLARGISASPATGSHTQHGEEQKSLIAQALA